MRNTGDIVGFQNVGCTIKTFWNILAEWHQNFKILVPVPHNWYWISGGRAKNFKVLMSSSWDMTKKYFTLKFFFGSSFIKDIVLTWPVNFHFCNISAASILIILFFVHLFYSEILHLFVVASPCVIPTKNLNGKPSNGKFKAVFLHVTCYLLFVTCRW
jgi:hypothetical protein